MMRTLFVALGRVYGLVQLYLGVVYVISMLPMLVMMMHTSESGSGPMTLQTFSGTYLMLTKGSMIATLILTLGAAWLLIFRTEWLADKLRLPAYETQPPVSADAIFHAGARLLALFVIIQAAPDLIGKLGLASIITQQYFGVQNAMDLLSTKTPVFPTLWSTLVAPALKLILGVFLLIRTDAILNWIQKRSRT